MLLQAGGVRDLGDRLVLSAGASVTSANSFLPRWRMDAEAARKLGHDRRWLVALGGGALGYQNGARTVVLSAGPTYYGRGWVATGRGLLQRSDPGGVVAPGVLLSLGRGQEGRQWTYVDVTYGRYAYLATALARPEEIREVAASATVRHRRWTGRRGGWLAEISWLRVRRTYTRLGVGAGAFVEWGRLGP